MRKFIQNKLKEQKGLTLIELLAVIVILAIIAAIAIPAIGNIIENSRVGAIKSDALNIMSAGELYFVDYPEKDTVDLKTLKAEGFNDDLGSFADGVDTADEVKVTRKTATAPTKFTGTGTTGKIQVVFTAASKDDIADYANSKRGATTGATVNASKK